MILCDSEIRAAIRNGDIIIDPPPADIATSAVDLTLAGPVSRWKPPQVPGVGFFVDPGAPAYRFHTFFQEFSEIIPEDSEGAIVPTPHEFVLALTQERIELPSSSRLAARVEGRSSLARLGLAIHLTAPTIHADWRGPIALEITNQGPLPIKLRPGMPICQLIIEQVFGTPAAEMRSSFQDQTSVAGKPADS